MTWAWPAALFGLLGVALLALVAWRATAAHHTRLAAVFRGGFDRTVLPLSVRRRRALAIACSLASLASVVVALAEPQSGQAEIDLEAEGVDIVLAVDLSRSMDARDVDPSRLERARREILDLAERLKGDRVGLVIYAGGAYPRMPLTLDYRALELLVRELNTHVFEAQGSNLAEAIREGVSLLEMADGTAGKAIVVLTDGEVHRPEAAYEAADEAADAGVAVYGWIIGTDTAPIPISSRSGPRFVQDPRTGENALTTPDTTVLEEVARRTSGAVVGSVAGTSDLEALYDREIRRSLRASVGRRGTRTVRESAVGLPLGIAVILGLLAAWLGDGRRTVLSLLFGLILLAPSSPALAADPATLQEADAAYRAGRTEQATRLYESLVAASPDDPQLLKRLGAARYRNGDPRGAAEAFDRAARSGDPDALYNAGNAWWNAGLLDRARSRYEDTLRRDPDHGPATQNLQLVQQAIQARQAEPPPPPETSPDPSDDAPSSEGNDQDDDDRQESGQGTPEDRQESTDPSQQQGSDQRQPQEGQQGQSTDQQADPQQQPAEGPPPEGGEQGEQDGSAEPQSSETSPEGAEGGSPQGDESPPEGDGTRAEKGDGEAPEDLEDVADPGEGGGGGDGEQGEETTEGDGEGGGTPLDAAGGEEASRKQAERILDGVEEGRPRVYVPGRGGELPW